MSSFCSAKYSAHSTGYHDYTPMERDIAFILSCLFCQPSLKSVQGWAFYNITRIIVPFWNFYLIIFAHNHNVMCFCIKEEIRFEGFALTL